MLSRAYSNVKLHRRTNGSEGSIPHAPGNRRQATGARLSRACRHLARATRPRQGHTARGEGSGSEFLFLRQEIALRPECPFLRGALLRINAKLPNSIVANGSAGISGTFLAACLKGKLHSARARRLVTNGDGRTAEAGIGHAGGGSVGKDENRLGVALVAAARLEGVARRAQG
jgi:hypothetical protein